VEHDLCLANLRCCAVSCAGGQRSAIGDGFIHSERSGRAPLAVTSLRPLFALALGGGQACARGRPFNGCYTALSAAPLSFPWAKPCAKRVGARPGPHHPDAERFQVAQRTVHVGGNAAPIRGLRNAYG